jgi:hyperosmotically inducible protein
MAAANTGYDSMTSIRTHLLQSNVLPIIVLLLFVSPGLTGCVAAVAAGAAGYYIGKDERTAGQIADDVAIGTTVKAKLVAEPGIRALGINVDVRDRIVTLNGTVNSQQDLNRVTELAKGVSGVLKVIPKLTIKSVDIEER